jgi:peroxiredoxin
MIMRPLLLVFILLSPYLAFCQGGLRLRLDTRPEGSTIRLSQFVGDETVVLDSVRYINSSEVVLRQKRSLPDGLFQLEIGSLEVYRFIIAENELVEGVLYESGSGMAFRTVGSKENDAYNILVNLSQNFSRSMDSLSRTMNSLSDFHPRHNAISDSLTSIYHRVAHNYNQSISLVTDLFPGSYAAQVLVPLDKVPLRTDRPGWKNNFDSDPAFNHVHFLHYVPWQDRRIVTNPFLSAKVLEYLYNFTERSQQGIETAIDRILGQKGMHPSVEAFLIELLVDFFTEKRATEYVAYIEEKYLGTCQLPISSELKAKFSALVPIRNGEVFPQLNLPDGDGMMVPIGMMRGDVNVVVVWSSTCPHCLRELPRLKELYDHMGSRKLNVYAISLDTDKEAWMQVIKNGNLNWINVNDLKGWESPVITEIGIVGTPAMFLLGHDLKLIGRASSFDDLRKVVKEMVTP